MLDPKKKLFRWGPISACPLFMYYTIESSFAPMKKLFGIGYPESVIVFKNNKVTWFLDQAQFVAQSKQFTRKVLLNEKNKERYFKLWDERTKLLVGNFQHLSSRDLASFSDNELVKEFKIFSKLYFDWWSVTMSVELVTVSMEKEFSTKLKTYFPQDHPKDYNEAFSALSSPLALTFYRREHLDLLKIYGLPKDEQKEALQRHQQKYYWILNSYAQGKILDTNYFHSELQKVQKDDYERDISEIESFVEKMREEKKKILDRISPDNELLRLMQLVEKFSQLQDERKMYNFMADHFLELFVRSFAKRTKRDASDLKLLLPDELAESLEFIDDKELKERKICFAFECDEDVLSTSGNNADAIANYLSQTRDFEQNVLQGMLASTGNLYYFRGTAKVILSIKEIDKIQEGDVLVTAMTSPDFVLGMKKAGAIVTDVGGILSHAAVVSRELGKPCIVGTEVATKIIKDGDVVELHCGRGTVKIVKAQV